MAEYREIAPSPRLAESIECFWTVRHDGPDSPHRVTPDGCADILFTRTGGRVKLEAIGPMTSYQDFPVAEAQVLVGVRFQPGMWTAHLGVPGDRVTNDMVPLDSLWGPRAKELVHRLADASANGEPLEHCASVFESAISRIEQPGRIQRAIAWMADRRGCVSIDELAGQAGFSVRQFRRVCLQQSGLTPKFLARVLRFRHALSRIQSSPREYATFALDCGYYDQAHFINEFRQLSGRTPSTYGNGRFFQSSGSGAP
jgi:AraC-like DNA-binding protein